MTAKKERERYNEAQKNASTHLIFPKALTVEYNKDHEGEKGKIEDYTADRIISYHSHCVQ